jgi:hypothetical protein
MKNLKTQIAALFLLTLWMLASAYGQLTPTGDAYTNTASPATNYGAKTLLDVESSQTTFIQFNLASIPAGYTSSNITKATLKLYVNTVVAAGSFNVDYVNGTWTESTLTANTAPALGTTIAASVPLVTADKNQYILIDITPAVQAWLSGTANDGIALVGNSPVNATFDSKETTSTSHPAELDIVFAGGGGSGISGITTASGSGLIGGGTSGTLNLSLTNTCGTKQVLQWTGSAWACASSGTGTVTSVASGAGLTGGPITGSGTLSIPAGGVTNTMLATSYAQLGAANTFAANQTVTGTLMVSSSGNTIIGNTSYSGNSVGYGVEGFASSTTGITMGVYGYSSSNEGVGVQGESPYIGLLGQGDTYGVYGANQSSSGNAPGVYGTSASTDGIGVEGSGFFAGVYGSTTATIGNVAGVYGTTASSNGFGVYGVGAFGVVGADSSGAGYGVYGTSTGGYGVLGQSDGVGVWGTGLTGVFGQTTNGSVIGKTVDIAEGLWGDAGDTGLIAVGILATADSDTALLTENNDSSGDYPAMQVENFTTQTHNPVFQTSSPNTYSGSRHCTIDTSANLTCTGVISGIVQKGDGRQTEVYAMQSAENWLEDAGSGQLSDGSARIELDPAYQETVNAGVEYHVFLTPNGDSKGLYVSHKTATSFEVHEQGGGSSSIAFDYRIMAKRKGYENVRLEDLTERFTQRAAPRQTAKRRLPTTMPKPALKMPSVPPMIAPPRVPTSPRMPTPLPVRTGVRPDLARQIAQPGKQ